MPEISKALYRAGEGEPVVLLHGFTATWHCWKPLLADLVPRYEVIAPTLAGHDGGPAWDPATPMNMEGSTDSLEKHLDELGIDTAHFVGNSMGGALAIQLAKRGRARSVVAISPGGGWSPDGPEAARISKFFKRQVGLTRASAKRIPTLVQRPRTRKLALRDVMRHGELVAPDDAMQLALGSLGCTVVDDVLRILDDNTAHLVDLDKVSAPTLLAWAENDRILPKESCSWALRRGIPGAEYRILPRTGHVPMWDDTKLCVDTIVEWVDRHSTATSGDTPAETLTAA